MPERVPFRELVSFARGGGWGFDGPRSEHTKVAVIRGTDFAVVKSRPSAAVPRRWESNRKLQTRILRPGDVVLEISGGSSARGQSTGRTLYVDESILSTFEIPVIPASFCRVLRFDTDLVEPAYAYYGLQEMYLSGRAAEYENQSTGISNFQFERFLDAEHLRLAPIKEQRAIVSVLRALDDKIAANHRIVDTAERLVLALMAQQGPSAPVGELADVLRDQVAPSTITADAVAHFSIPAYDRGRMPEQVAPADIKSGKFRVSRPVVLVSKLNPATPRCWLVDPVPDIPALASTEFLVLRPRNALSPSALWAACSHPPFWEELVGKATGTSNSHQRVRPADLLATEVSDPRTLPPSLLAQVHALCKRAGQARAESLRLAKLRDVLLPRLMSGEIRVREAEQAVADRA